MTSSSKESVGGTDDNLIDLSHFTGTGDERSEVRALFNRHRVVLAQSDDDLACTNAVQHRIRTTDDIPVTMPYRRIPPKQLDEVKDHLQRLVRTGAIVESKSDLASAVVFVRKRSGALRMCCDFRALNAKTEKDAYPLPRIDESMDALAGARWFSTLDLQSAYTQVPTHPEDQHKTAFTTPFGLYEHRRMAFGLCNAPATFQRLMQTAFREEMFSILLCYLDDVLIFSSTIAEQLQRLDTVFTRLTEYGLKLERKKCAFFQSEVQYLGQRKSQLYNIGQATTILHGVCFLYLRILSKLPAVEQRWAAAQLWDQVSSGKTQRERECVIAPHTRRDGLVWCRQLLVEEFTRTTKQPAEIRDNAVEAREQAPAIMSDSIGTVPSISPADTRELQKSDDVLQRVIWYRNRGRHPDIRERSDESKAALALLAMGQRIVEHDGVLYRHVTTPGGSHFCHLAWSLQHCAACMTEQGTRGALLTWRRSYTPTMSPRMAKLAIRHIIWCSGETAGYLSTCYWGERSRPVMVGSSTISVGCMTRMRKQRHSWTTTPTSERRVMIATHANFHLPPGSACIIASTPNAPLLWTVRDQVDREETSSSSPVSDCSSTSGDEEENIRPVTLRRTCRTRAGTHTNPGNWPRSANR